MLSLSYGRIIVVYGCVVRARACVGGCACACALCVCVHACVHCVCVCVCLCVYVVFSDSLDCIKGAGTPEVITPPLTPTLN